MAREIRVSPDGNSVAVRSDFPDDAWNAWGVMNAINGGHWSATSELAGWAIAVADESRTLPAAAEDSTDEVPVPGEATEEAAK